jgi:cold shock CspA family protein
LIATDRRNGKQRAISVCLDLEKTKSATNEFKRECGVVAAVKVLEGFGFIKCQSRDSRMFFHCSELIDSTHRIKMSDEVEFTVLPDHMAESKRLHATRIQILPKGSVQFQSVSKATYTGLVDADAKTIEITDPDDEEIKTVRINDNLRKTIQPGSKVTFKIIESRRTGDKTATDVNLVEEEKTAIDSDQLLRGTVILKKDSYGFIESEDHSRETFFHYSELSCKPEEIEHGTTVQYYEKLKDNKICGINVVPLEEEIDLNGDEDVEDHVRHGTVRVELKSGSTNYGGIIVSSNEEIRFTSTSMADKKALQVGDNVCYQHGINQATGVIRAVNVQAKRRVQVSVIDSIKGDYGFIVFDEEKKGENAKSLFFHSSNLIDLSMGDLSVGDSVSFSLIHNRRSGKSCAAGVRLVKRGSADKEKEADRPERLKMRLSMKKSESQNGETAVIRQPKGPEAQGVKGFGRQMSRKTGDSSSDPNESSSDENREKLEAMSLNESDNELENDFKEAEEVNGHDTETNGTEINGES